MSSINSITVGINLYVGFPIFICGTFGNLIHIRLLWRNRRNPCAFLFMYSSTMNFIVLFFGLFTRILSVGFQQDWSSNNQIWCKARVTLPAVSYLASLTCMWLASIDRFLVSCRQEKYRKLSRLSFAFPAAIIGNITWLIHFMPYFIYADLFRNPATGLTACGLFLNDGYNAYTMYFSLPIFYGLLPSTILVVTGIMTFNNVNHLQAASQRQLIQKQLTSMMLIQIPITLLTTLPFVAFQQYTAFTATIIKTSDRRAIESVVSSVVSTASYITFACPFYASLVSSKSFRNEAKALLLCQSTNLSKVIQIQPNPPTNMKNTQTIPMKTTETALKSNAPINETKVQIVAVE